MSSSLITNLLRKLFMYSLSVDARKKCRNRIANDEGFRSHAYRDSKGFLTIGFGFNLDKSELPMEIALNWLEYLINDLEIELSKHIKTWGDLSDARKSVLINMAYQMGIDGLLKFKNMFAALDNHDYKAAADCMKDSVWYREFTNRASRLITMMISGEF